MRTPAINAALEASLSRDRLGKYLEVADGDLDHAVTLYERNTRLCEAFYSPLQSLEVCLRNRLSIQMAQRYGTDWLDNGKAPLGNDAVAQIEEVRSSLDPNEQSPGKIVADLRFAFWVGLLAKRYDATLWRQALHKAFLARGGVKRNDVHGRFNAVRRFRNRIAHHEPIFHRDVKQTHDEVIEAIAWMCRDTAAWAKHHSRFVDVYEGRLS